MTYRLTDGDLRKAFDPQTLRRGRGVHVHERVRRVDASADGLRITGSVQGSERRPYDQNRVAGPRAWRHGGAHQRLLHLPRGRQLRARRGGPAGALQSAQAEGGPVPRRPERRTGHYCSLAANAAARRRRRMDRPPGGRRRASRQGAERVQTQPARVALRPQPAGCPSRRWLCAGADSGGQRQAQEGRQHLRREALRS